MKINNTIAKEYAGLMEMTPKQRKGKKLNKRMYEIWNTLKASGVGTHVVGEYTYTVFNRKPFKGRKAAVVVILSATPVKVVSKPTVVVAKAKAA